MRYLFDTDTLSNLLKKVPSSNLLTRLAKLKRSDQFTTTITMGEMVYGAFKSDRAAYFLERLDHLLLPNLTILSFDELAARKYDEIRATLERAGVAIGESDLRIASICLVNHLILITGNTKHFSRITELKIQNWL